MIRTATWEEVVKFGSISCHDRGLLPPIAGGARRSYAQVGALGAVNSTGAATANTPAWDAGNPRRANNLGIVWVAGTGATTAAGLPAGWSTSANITGTTCSAAIFHNILTGGDTAPTIASVASVSWTTQLAEFQGNKSAGVKDHSTNVTGTTTPLTATQGTGDATAYELFVYLGLAFYSVAATKSNSVVLNNGMAASEHNNNGTSSAIHYNFGFGIQTSNSAGNQALYNFVTTNITGAIILVCSYLLGGPLSDPSITTQGVQAAMF